MTTAISGERVSLYYREGSSDKEYHASIEPRGTAFVVNFAYGRRGSTLQTGTKTPQVVDYHTARRILDQLVREKTAKGYSPGTTPGNSAPGSDAPGSPESVTSEQAESSSNVSSPTRTNSSGGVGTPYVGTPREPRYTGVLPQLLNPIDEGIAEHLLSNPAWWAQEKYDGKRVLIRRRDQEITGINRKGLVIALPQPIHQQALQSGCRHWLLDGEAISDCLYVFDLLQWACNDCRSQPYAQRLRLLANLNLSESSGAIRSIPTARTWRDKRDLLNRLRVQNKEGIVFKRHDAMYLPGRPNSMGPALKFKFTASASCIVAGTNGSKRSVKLQLLDPAGKRVGVGSVTIPPNHPIPEAGSIVEVRYLYAYSGASGGGGALFQPVYLGQRDDLAVSACATAQLKFKPNPEAQDGE